MQNGKLDGVAELTAADVVAHLKRVREELSTQWVEEMMAKGVLVGMTPDETAYESAVIYDICVGCMETGRYDGAERYAAQMAQRGVLAGMTPAQILAGMLTLRDVFGRSIFDEYGDDQERLSQALRLYEPVANQILAIVALAFVQERESIVRQQQEAIRELSTPALQIRPGLLMLPIIGLFDSARARQLTEQLLQAIRASRARAVVIDITGVPAVDSQVANHLLQTVDACGLMGARVVLTGMSPEIAQTIVTIGVDLSRIRTVADLQTGIEEADRWLGYVVTRADPVL
jgi:rsbT co-antagonist protein RsbR